jgi:hypothetical protein
MKKEDGESPTRAMPMAGWILRIGFKAIELKAIAAFLATLATKSTRSILYLLWLATRRIGASAAGYMFLNLSVL